MTRPLLLVGAGGFARETAELVRALCASGAASWDLLGYLDDAPGLAGRTVSGARVLGPVDAVHEHPDAAIVVCTGNPTNYTTRRAIVERLGLSRERYATLVHPAAVVPPSAVLGVGTVVHATTVLTVDVTVGDHVAIMPAVVLTHDDVVEDYVTIGAGARLAGGVRVERGAYVGSGASVRENLRVGAWSQIGMGAVVTRDVPPATVWAGVPARELRPAAGPVAAMLAGTSLRPVGKDAP
jgi:sugar O-acyltransferase (sialic acid O-acetyltransferase NeuD family)